MGTLSYVRKTNTAGRCSVCGCEGVHAEFAEEYPIFDNYINKGVVADTKADEFRLSYNGLLAKNRANDIYAVVSYGDNKNWNDIKYYPMDNTGGANFEVSLPINKNMNLNVAFKDNADNWDNNSGKNYSFNAH
ncbi:MAG: carbohydrate-binding protein [Clostridia bacterium]|nr:carbohydrate-binding protein [Clostridia bacterium]